MIGRSDLKHITHAQSGLGRERLTNGVAVVQGRSAMTGLEPFAARHAVRTSLIILEHGGSSGERLCWAVWDGL